jgi:hypothetical protein
MKKLGAAIVLVSASFLCSAADSNLAFERGALTPMQQNAWQSYVTSEASIFGCEYGDDPRLTEEPSALFEALANGEQLEPVMITYRSLMNMGPNSRALISNNVVIASMECNPVYYTGEEIIGMPVIPLEEAITILHDDLANFDDMERIRSLRNTFVVAGMDPRWFWTFFVADRAHMDLLGYDFDTLVKVEQALSNRDEALPYEQDDYNLLTHIHDAMNHYAVKFYANSDECETSGHEPSKALMVWPDLTDSIVQSFYVHHEIRFKGKWKTKGKVEDGGVTLYQETPVDNPNTPHFNVTRGMTISSVECAE